MIVKGKIRQNADKDAGVVINGMLAQVNGRDFAAIVPLQQGQNTITANALDADGLAAESMITISTYNLQEPLRFTVNPSSGVPAMKADGSISFTATMMAEAYLSDAVTNYSWDINGDGIAEQAGAVLTEITAIDQNSGIYFPTVTVTDAVGNAYTETTIVNVLDRNILYALLKAKWERMKVALVKGNVEEALKI